MKNTNCLFQVLLSTTRNICCPSKSEKMNQSTVQPTSLWESKVCTEDCTEWDGSPAPAVLQTNAVHTGQLSAWIARGESLKNQSCQVQVGSHLKERALGFLLKLGQKPVHQEIGGS